MNRRIEKDEEIHGRIERSRGMLENQLDESSKICSERIGKALQEFASNFDVRGAKGDYLELKQQIQLLREKVYGENSTFCAHGVTPRLCEKCNVSLCGESVQIPFGTMPCEKSKGHDGIHVFREIPK